MASRVPEVEFWPEEPQPHSLPPIGLPLQSRILDLVDTAIIAVDLDGQIIYANAHACKLYGWTREELLGTPAREMAALAIGATMEAEIAEAIGAGRSWEGTFDVRRKDGSLATIHCIDSPLYGVDGSLAGIVSAGMDGCRERQAEVLLHERTRAAQVSQFLADCSSALASYLDYEQALGALGRLCVPFMADICLIDIAEAGQVRRMVAVHRDQEFQGLVEEMGRRFPPDPEGFHPAVQALRTGEPAVSPDMSEEFLKMTTRDPEHFRIVKKLNFQSFICVPLTAHGRILGALTLVSCDESRRYEPPDLAVAQEIAWRASLTIDNARIFTESAHVAQVLQASLMPPSLPTIPGVELAARYVAFGSGNEVGGDFYDVFSAGYGAWVLAVGDVCGRGPEAAAVTGLIRHTLRSAVLEVRQPGRLLSVANEVLRQDKADSELFSTLVCGILRARRNDVRISLANAGHPPPIVIRRDGSVEIQDHGDPIIGTFDDARWMTRALVLHVGDILVAYTDGITEARRGRDFYGEERLLSVLRESSGQPAESIADRVITSVQAFVGEELTDDVALIALRVVEQ
jgi:PAS domain S-box-containing protein